MKLSRITIENFKGINKVELDLSKSPHNNVYTLVGINESGKTTILEAINFFEYNGERNLNIEQIDYEDMIPIKMKTNFNGDISITSQITLDENDNNELRDYLHSNYQYRLSSNISSISVIQKYTYKNSKFVRRNFTWPDNLINITKKGWRIPRNLHSVDKEHWQNTINYLKTKMPKILYFPTAFFDLPDRVCLSNAENSKDQFLQLIIQDILDSLNEDLDIETHIINRVKEGSFDLIRQLSLKMSRKINEVILDEWKKILNKSEYNINIVVHDGDKTDDEIYLEFSVEGQDGIFKLSERSLGFRWFFMFLLLTQFRGFRKNESRHVIFLFDEPAANLSSKAQKQLLESLQGISDKCTIIYTTHSHHLVNPNWLEGAHVVSNDALEKGDLESFNTKNTNIKLEKYRSYVNSNPQNTSYFQPILDVLEYVPNELNMTLPSIIVEGKNDFYTLKYFFNIHLGKNEACLVPGMSCNNVDTLISLFYSWGKEFIVLLDSDDTAQRSKERYNELFGEIVKNRIFMLKDINPKWKKSLEDIISKPQQLEIQKQLFPDSKKYSKKMFNKAIQELLMTRRKISLPETIISDFDSIYLFITSKIKMNGVQKA